MCERVCVSECVREKECVCVRAAWHFCGGHMTDSDRTVTVAHGFPSSSKKTLRRNHPPHAPTHTHTVPVNAVFRACGAM